MLSEFEKTTDKDYICPICGNKDIHSIGYLNGKPYCRKCISFKGEEVEYKESNPKEAPFNLSYELSPEQKELSNRLVSNYTKGIDSLVYAVTGSGKTEICLSLIQLCLSSGKTVGFTVPRRSVCVEIMLRFRDIFKHNKVIAVYGGHNKQKVGDIVCLTTHQLFRYEKYFDLLIIDEIDAFPFKGDEVLNKFFYRAIKGNYVILTATPSDELIKEHQKKGKDLLKLFTRFHRHPLPVPKLLSGNSIKLYYKLIKQIILFKKENKQVFVFVPTVKMSKQVALLLKLFIRDGRYINSKTENNAKIINDFRNKKHTYLVTTAILERGITVKDLQVVVLFADHKIYDHSSLIQIAGRAGRKKAAPEGEVIFYAKTITDEMRRAVEDIERYNKALQDLLQRDKK